MQEPEPVPRGLVLFSPRTPPGYRRRRFVFLVLFALTCVSLIWPGYMLARGIRPFLFHLPLSLAWIVIWLVVTCLGLAWLYRSERAESEPGARHG